MKKQNITKKGSFKKKTLSTEALRKKQSEDNFARIKEKVINEMIDEIWAIFDEDKNGVLDYKEMVQFIELFMKHYGSP